MPGADHHIMRRAISTVVVVLGAASLVLVWSGTASSQIPTIPTTVPIETTIPGLTIPTLVDVTTTTLPVVTTTTIAVPEVTVVTTIPGVTVPTLPGVTVPTIPGVTVPTLPGVTVPTVPGTTVPTGTVVACSRYLSQSAAQAALDGDASLAGLLDPDGDGFACGVLVPVVNNAPASGPGPSGAAPGAGGVQGANGMAGSSVYTPYAPGAVTAQELARSDGALSGGATRRYGSIRAATPSAADAVQAAATSALPSRDADPRGLRHVVLKVVAFAMLLGVTAAAAAKRDLLFATIPTAPI